MGLAYAAPFVGEGSVLLMAATLVTLAQAKGHLQINTPTVSPLDSQDADIEMKLAQAEDIILDYLKVQGQSPPEWTISTVPPLVQAAILLQLAELFRFRGDDAGGGNTPVYEDGQLSPSITNILRRYRDPALA